MDAIFWTGLVIGAVLSLIASVAANLWHERIVSFLSGTKSAFTFRRYKKAARFHALVCDFHNGTHDKYYAYIGWWCISAGYFTSAFTFLAVGLLAALIGKTMLPPDPSILDRITALLPCLILLMIGLFFAYASYRAFIRVSNIYSALVHFDDFDADFKREWSQHVPPASPTAGARP